jgi:hypothetical protein
MEVTQLSDPFMAKAMDRIEELSAARQKLVQQVEMAQSELRRIDEESADLARTMAAYAAFMDMTDFSPRPMPETKPRTAHLDLPRGSYGPLAYQALVELGGEATLGQIVEHLQRAGRIPSAQHAYYSTRSALNRQPDLIVKTGDGFRLIELKHREAG